jgi:cytochrome c553
LTGDAVKNERKFMKTASLFVLLFAASFPATAAADAGANVIASHTVARSSCAGCHSRSEE